MAIEVGASATTEFVVDESCLAIAIGSGDVPALATPQVVAWCENVTMAALDGHLESGDTSVGMRVRLDHVRSTPLGATVSVSARLTLIEGRRLTFDVHAESGEAEIATGQVVRVLVGRDGFLERLAGRPS